MPLPKWSIYLVCRDDKRGKHLQYMGNLTEVECREWTGNALVKLFDGSDADAVVITCSDYLASVSIKVQHD